MKRFPLVFLSLVILVTCTWLASSSPRVGKAAQDRALPWWFGDYEDDFYHEHACVDGMNLWILAIEGEASNKPSFSIQGKLVDSGLEVVNKTLPFQFTETSGPMKGAPYAEYTFRWAQNLQPGTVVEFKFYSDAFVYGPEWPYIWRAYIRDCNVPTPPVNGQFRMVFAREFYDGEWWDLELDIPADGCVVEKRLIGVARNFVISDADVSIEVASDSPALLSAKLTSPSGTSVQFIDDNHSPAYEFGTTVRDEELSINVAGAQRDYKWPGYANTLIFDDDSTYELVDMSTDYIDMVVKPWPDKLSAFNGEESAGEWYLEICNSMPTGSAILQKWAIILEQDTIPPAITGVEATILSATSAVVEWQTDEPADSQVSYGTVSGSHPLNTNKSAFVTDHSITLTGLMPDTTYFFKVSSTDGAGNNAKSSEVSFTTEADDVQYTLTVTANGQGTTQINPTKSTYQDGEVVTLTAAPNNGYLFTGWSGDAGGTANPIQITMNGNKSITATFTPIEADTYTLQTTTTGSGTIQRDPDLEAYPSGQKVILTAVADDGYLFSGWSGDASGMETPIQITMNGNKSVTASFAPISPDTYTLQTPTSGGGIILRNPNQTVYQSGQVVTLTADPDYGYVFNGWSGDASGTTNPIQITMDGNKFVTTFFELVGPNTYTLNTPSSAGGSINRNPDKPVYQSGEVVTLTAVPANGYLFDAWNGDANGWGNPTQITMDSNKSVGATFTPIGNSDDFINFMPLVIR